MSLMNILNSDTYIATILICRLSPKYIDAPLCRLRWVDHLHIVSDLVSIVIEAAVLRSLQRIAYFPQMKLT